MDYKRPILRRANLVAHESLRDLTNEAIFNALKEINYGKISIPVYTTKKFMGVARDDNDNKLCAVGYVKSFNPETRVFSVIIYGNNSDNFRGDFEVSMIPMVFTEDGNFRTVLKLIIFDTENKMSGIDKVDLIMNKPGKYSKSNKINKE